MTAAPAPAWERGRAVRALAAIFAGQARSPAHAAIFREVYGEDWPEEAAPLNYCGVPELRRIAAAIAAGPGQVLADLGCGGGGPGLWVAREAGAALVGIDMVPAAVAAARARARGVFPDVAARFLPGDIAALPFADASLDAAISLAVFWMVPEPGRALAEAARVLRPGARLAFTDWSRTSSPPGLLPPVADHRPLLEEAGFRVLDYAEVAGAEARRRQVYARYLDRQEALRREMGLEAAATLVREANRALGRLDGVDHLANSRLVLAVAERWPDGRGAPGGRGAGPSHPLRPTSDLSASRPTQPRSGAHCPRSGSRAHPADDRRGRGAERQEPAGSGMAAFWRGIRECSYRAAGPARQLQPILAPEGEWMVCRRRTLAGQRRPEATAFRRDASTPRRKAPVRPRGDPTPRRVCPFGAAGPASPGA